MTVGGFSYAEEPERRLALINEHVLRQGENFPPGITLEQVGSAGVIQSFEGFRFRP